MDEAQMSVTPSPAFGTFGAALVDDVRLPGPALNLLFASLLVTALGVFTGGNLLLFDPSVLWQSALIVVPSIGVMLVFYTLSRQLASLTWGLVLTYGLMWLLVYSRRVELQFGFYASMAASGAYTLRFLRLERRYWWPVFLMAVIATATILGVERAYTSFDMLPRLYAGDVEQDTLFHVSIAAMIKHYGVVSTGLHGLVETPYHSFSHTLMAAVSVLSGRAVVEVYGVASWVLFAPLLIFSIAALCAMLDRTGLWPLPLVWGLTALLLAAMPFLASRWAVWDSYFISESYLVSLGLFLLGQGLLYKWRLTVVDLLLVLLLAAMIANAKASVGLIFSGLWLARLLFVRGCRWTFDLGAFLLSSVAVGWVVLASAQASAGTMVIDPLNFLRTYSFMGEHLSIAGSALLSGGNLSIKTTALALIALASFLAMHFLLSWLVVAQISYRQGIGNLLRSPLGVYTVAATLAGLAIVGAFAIPGGSAGYFSNVAFFVALPAVVTMLTVWVDRRGVDYRPALIIGISVVALLGLPAYYRASALSSRYDRQAASPLIDQLLLLRAISPMHIVLRPSSDILSANPVQRCTAQPFVYPAVSERPWVHVIQGAAYECQYSNYGYLQYGITAQHPSVGVSPRLLPGMSVQDALGEFMLDRLAPKPP